MKRLFSLLHRWLGLVSGLIVMVVCLTGSLYVFRDEVEAVCEPWRRVPVRDAEMLPPSALLKAADEASALTLGTAGEAARLDAYTPQGTTTTYVDPYTGEVLKVIRREPGDAGFFAFLLDGHRNLWLPRSIGGPLVSYAVLVFFLALGWSSPGRNVGTGRRCRATSPSTVRCEPPVSALTCTTCWAFMPRCPCSSSA